MSEFNRLNSDHPIGFLGELDLTNVGGPVLRYVNERENVVFQSQTYTSTPFLVQEFGHGTIESPKTLEVVVGNGNLLVSSLKEQFWRGQLHPLWLVRLWLVDMTNPDMTPASQHATLRVMGIEITDVVGQLRLADDVVSTTRHARMRRFTPRDGFPNMRFT